VLSDQPVEEDDKGVDDHQLQYAGYFKEDIIGGIYEILGDDRGVNRLHDRRRNTNKEKDILKIRMALLVGVACLVLVSFSLSLGLLYGWDSMLIILTHIVLPYVLPFCLFVVGYAALFTRQARAHAQTQTLLHELESAHRQLADYAVRIEELTRTAERQRLAREFHSSMRHNRMWS